MLRILPVVLALVALAALGPAAPAAAYESGETCDIEDDAVQPDILEDLKRILKEINGQTS